MSIVPFNARQPMQRGRRTALAKLAAAAGSAVCRTGTAGIKGLSAGALAAVATRATAADDARLHRIIASTGERLPAIGMGSWITFNVGNDESKRAARAKVLAAFFAAGGGLVDSSPMYGSAEAVIGDALGRLGSAPSLFSATKVWTDDRADGRRQVQESLRLWGLERFDLLQVHNLLGWEGHLEELAAMKTAGRLRYVGITTSHGRRHADLEDIMQRHALDFVQLTYNPIDREVEQRLLPLARERGIAIIVNRPFQRGALLSRLQGKPLPAVAEALECVSWAQLLLKFVVSHPSVTCVIPATSRVEHMNENMNAGLGPQPDERAREAIARAVADA